MNKNMLQNFHNLGIRKKIIAGTPKLQTNQEETKEIGLAPKWKLFPLLCKTQMRKQKSGPHVGRKQAKDTCPLWQRTYLNNPQSPVLTHDRFLKVQTSRHFTRRRKRESKWGDADVTSREHSACIRLAGETPVGVPWIEKTGTLIHQWWKCKTL